MLLYPYQMNHGLDAILDFKPKMILLSRNNKLAWYSSLKIAQETGTWYIDERNCAVQHTISFNAKEFNEILELNTLCEKIILRELKYRNIDYIKFDYDELIQDNIIKQILDFLDLPYANLESHVLAQNTLNILKRFKNQEEVISFAAAKEKLAWLEQVPDNNFKK
jgi:LPS sulfotransferase NodH